MIFCHFSRPAAAPMLSASTSGAHFTYAFDSYRGRGARVMRAIECRMPASQPLPPHECHFQAVVDLIDDATQGADARH